MRYRTRPRGCGGHPFDLVVRLSTSKKGARITIPTCRTKPLNKWLSRTGAQLIQGCTLSEGSLTLWVKEPDVELAFAPREDAIIYGAYLGMTKLLTITDGNRSAYLGRDYGVLQKRIRGSKPGSRARARLLTERDHLVGRVLNAIPWNHLDVIGIEDLKGITRGKGKLGKEFRRQRSPWAHRKVRTRLEAKAQENRVLKVAVSPGNTSRECPACRCVSALNRKGELFRCVGCRLCRSWQHPLKDTHNAGPKTGLALTQSLCFEPDLLYDPPELSVPATTKGSPVDYGLSVFQL